MRTMRATLPKGKKGFNLRELSSADHLKVGGELKWGYWGTLAAWHVGEGGIDGLPWNGIKGRWDLPSLHCSIPVPAHA